MKFRPIIFLSFLTLAGCQSTPVQERTQTESDGEWHRSTLSEQTIAKVNAGVADYRQCLTDAIVAQAKDRRDPRDIANTILKTCEPQLPAIKTAFDAENVPANLSERYLRKTRSQGAQSVLRSVQAVHALRAAEEEDAKEAVNHKKKPSAPPAGERDHP
ncbi:MAG: hypothetical protein PHE55_00960 [Methylococcaceae bacterium]|nr:hypothetical protein [Methylococcaceae bacterium]